MFDFHRLCKSHFDCLLFLKSVNNVHLLIGSCLYPHLVRSHFFFFKIFVIEQIHVVFVLESFYHSYERHPLVSRVLIFTSKTRHFTHIVANHQSYLHLLLVRFNFNPAAFSYELLLSGVTFQLDVFTITNSGNL